MSVLGARATFEDAFVRWRFGDLDAGAQAIAGARSLLATEPSAAIHLKLGLLLQTVDPVAAAVEIDRARRLGADIPRPVSRLDEAGAPPDESREAPVMVESREVEGPGVRALSPPSGDPWHPAFDQAATTLPSLSLSVIERGSISVDVTQPRPQVYMFDASGTLVRDLSTGPKPFRDSPMVHPGPLVLLDDAFAAFNVCHALFDKFPRLELYEARWPGRRLTGLMFRDHSYYRQAMAAFGHDMIAPPASGRFTVQAEQLALLSNYRRGEVRHPGRRGAAWAARFIEQRLQSATPGSRRLFVSRSDATVVRLVNHIEVEDFFAAHGFEIITPSLLSFTAQKALFGQASHIAGVHGAGMANLAFAAPGIRVFEMMPPLAGSMAHWVMAQTLGQYYWLFVANDAQYPVRPGASYDSALTNRPIRVDLTRLKPALAAFLA